MLKRSTFKLVSSKKIRVIVRFTNILFQIADIFDQIYFEENDCKEFKKYFEIAKTALEEIFDKHGLQKISPLGKMFDPTMHDAIRLPDEQVYFKIIIIVTF